MPVEGGIGQAPELHVPRDRAGGYKAGDNGGNRAWDRWRGYIAALLIRDGDGEYSPEQR